MNQSSKLPCRRRERVSIGTRRPVSGKTDKVAADVARYYDLDVANERDDIDMYLALASAVDGPILELACGSGRICVPLAAAGHEVVGVDIDEPMLDRARASWRRERRTAEHTGSLTLLRQDASAMELGRRFDLAILGFNSLLVIGGGDPAAQRATLNNMSRHLADDGRAVIDTWLPTPDDLMVYDGREVREWTRTDPAAGAQVSKSVTATFDPVTRRATIDTHFASGDGRASRRDVIHFPTRGELFEMIESADLKPQQIAGDYDMSPLDPDSERVIVVAAVGHSAPDSAA